MLFRCRQFASNSFAVGCGASRRFARCQRAPGASFARCGEKSAQSRRLFCQLQYQRHEQRPVELGHRHGVSVVQRWIDEWNW